MKRRIILSIVLVLSIASLSLMNSDSTAKASRRTAHTYDTGIVPLGPGQTLRIMATPQSTGTVTRLRFRVVEVALVSSDNMTVYTPTGETTFDEITLARGQGASTDVRQSPAILATRVYVLSHSPDIAVNGLIIDSVTGAVVASVKVTSYSVNGSGLD